MNTNPTASFPSQPGQKRATIRFGGPGLAPVRRLAFSAASVLQCGIFDHHELGSDSRRFHHHFGMGATQDGTRIQPQRGEFKLNARSPLCFSIPQPTKAGLKHYADAPVLASNGASSLPPAHDLPAVAGRQIICSAGHAGRFCSDKTVTTPDVGAPGSGNDGAQLLQLAHDLPAVAGRRIIRSAGPAARESCFIMTKYFKKYRHLTALFAVLVMAFAIAMLGLSLGVPLKNCVATGVTIVALWQLSQFAMSKRHAVCYISGITAEQAKEFEDILKQLGEWKGDLTGIIREFPQLKAGVDSLRRAGLARGASNPSPGQISDGCAEWFGAVAILGLEKRGKLEGQNREALLTRSSSILGVETRTALSSSDIPLPTQYSGEVVALVGMFGTARRFGTVFPLGAATVKLPRLKTDSTFGLLTQSTTIAEKSPQTEWVTFTPEKFGGLVRMPNELDADSIVALGRFIAEYAARQLAYVEYWQFWRSTGAASGINGTAEGLTKSVATDSKTTTSTGLGSPCEFSITHFRTLRGVCDAGALRRGAYYLHPSFEALLATFNTSGNKPFNPAAQISGSGANPMTIVPTLDGYPIYWIDVMPVYTTSDALSTVHVLFGDVSYNYLGVRGTPMIQTSIEAAFVTDEILVRALERLTVGKMATGAVAGLITAAA
jgi:HK97 family phage major capsid protein